LGNACFLEVKSPRLTAPIAAKHPTVSPELRCPAVAGVKAAEPFLPDQLAWRLEEVRIALIPMAGSVCLTIGKKRCRDP
jgi:hypothetical protein